LLQGQGGGGGGGVAAPAEGYPARLKATLRLLMPLATDASPLVSE